MMLKKLLNKVRCKVGNHPPKDAPIIELWIAENSGQFVVFKCARCNSTVGSTWHESR